MPKTLVYFLPLNQTCLIIFCSIFPLSVELSIFCFVLFLISRISLGNFKYGIYLQIFMVMAIAASTITLVVESRSHFYPVSYFDYALVLITVGIISHNPLDLKAIHKVCWVISLSPIAVFIRYLYTFGLTTRNHWGFENPNWLGLYCSMCLPLTLCLLAQQLTQTGYYRRDDFQSAKTQVYILIASVVSTCLMMISSGSRSSFYTSLVTKYRTKTGEIEESRLDVHLSQIEHGVNDRSHNEKCWFAFDRVF